MAEFSIGGVAYQSRMMDGEVQTLVLKRLLPTFTTLVGCAPALRGAEVAEPAGEEAATPAISPQDILLPVARELASLSDGDVQFILNACLQVTQRQVANAQGWVPVVQRGNVQHDADTKFATRLQIAWHVLAENFGEMLGSFGLDVDRLAQAAPKRG